MFHLTPSPSAYRHEQPLARAARVAVALAAIVGAGVACPHAAADNPVSRENALLGTADWITRAPPEGTIEGYATETTVAPGEIVHFHVSATPARSYRIEIYRLGWYSGVGARLVGCIPTCTEGEGEPGSPQPYPPPGATQPMQADWPVTDSFAIPTDAASGYYIARLRLLDGPWARTAATVVFIVREPPARASTILVVAPVNTWQAYNPWGGKSLYSFNSTDGVPATSVSFLRPLSPRSQWPFDFEYPLVRYLERNGWDVSYTSDRDVDADPSILLRHRLIVVAGHSEYWSRKMRRAFDDAKSLGTNIAFIGANDAYWQVRYSESGDAIVSYKSADDPEENPRLKTILFRDISSDDAECHLIGVQHEGGKRPPGTPPLSYSVSPAGLADRWLSGTGFTTDSTLYDLVGYEWDTYDPQCLSAPTTMFFWYQGPPNAAALRYIAPSGARVFASGTMQFSWGLDSWGGHDREASSPLQRFVANAFADMTRPAPPALRAHVVSSGVVSLEASDPDPRIRLEFLRIDPQAPELKDAPIHGVVLCATTSRSCLTRATARSTATYAAVAIDEWGSSDVAVLTPLAVRPMHATVRLTIERRQRERFTCRISARPAGFFTSNLSYAWRVDGVRANSRSLQLRLRPGLHSVSVTVTDAFNAKVSATARVRITHTGAIASVTTTAMASHR